MLKLIKKVMDNMSVENESIQNKKEFTIIGGKVVYEDNVDTLKKEKTLREDEEVKVKEESFNPKPAKEVKIIESLDLEDQEETFYQEEREEIKMEKRGKRISSKLLDSEISRILRLNYSKSTEETYKLEVKYWKSVAKRLGKTLYSLEAYDIEKALEEYMGRTKVKKLSTLKLISKIYLRNEMYKLSIEIQKTYIKKKIDKNLSKYLEEEKYLELKSEVLSGVKAKSRPHLWLGLFLFCGLRISEIKSISIEENWIKVMGKGSKERLVPCPKFLIKGLKEMKEFGKGGWRSNEKNIDKYLRRNGYLKCFHCHQLRHTYATYLHRNGVDLNVLKKLLGHTTIATTQIYAQSKVDESILELFKFEEE